MVVSKAQAPMAFQYQFAQLPCKLSAIRCIHTQTGAHETCCFDIQAKRTGLDMVKASTFRGNKEHLNRSVCHPQTPHRQHWLKGDVCAKKEGQVSEISLIGLE